MKKRLDQLLVDRGLFPSRTQAQAAIMAGMVYVDGQKSDKAGKSIPSDVKIEVKGKPHPYVSRGGVKMEKALKEFNVKVEGKVALDIGASTGGFTDCLLQNGAEKVYAVDVGYGQIDWKLRQDPRVKVIERTNARNLTLQDLGLKTSDIGLCVIDVSFISLSKILPAVYDLLMENAEIIALIKPQFEAKREQVGKGGIVKDGKVHQDVINKVESEAKKLGFRVKGSIPSPIAGADGNVEFLMRLTK
jgi:23S rRNA (cytidine1920-2'-O)/16S rRNA (cytidine1409-2'-O)-methyltransferase